MIALIAENREGIIQLCRRHRVRVLELFGSAADGSFQPESSDVDFLVEFESLQRGEHYDCYFGLLEGLQDLLRRKVDLVDPDGMRNPYFIRRVNESRRPVYDARS